MSLLGKRWRDSSTLNSSGQPEVCIAELSRVTQRAGESANLFIIRFKRMRNICKIMLLEGEYVKMAQKGLDIKLRKKFQGMEFHYFYELTAKVSEYKEFLREENQRKKASMGTYFQEMSNNKVATTDLTNTRSCVCLLLEKKTLKAWQKSQTSNPQMQYIFEVSKIEQIFDFLLKEKFLKLPTGHKIPTTE